MTKSFGLALCDRRLRALARPALDASTPSKMRALKGAHAICDWRESKASAHERQSSNCSECVRSVAGVDKPCLRGGRCCDLVAGFAFLFCSKRLAVPETRGRAAMKFFEIAAEMTSISDAQGCGDLFYAQEGPVKQCFRLPHSQTAHVLFRRKGSLSFEQSDEMAGGEPDLLR